MVVSACEVTGKTPDGDPLLIFYGRHTIFSNFHLAGITIFGMKFSCSEGYYQWSKAVQFGSWELADKIRLAESPAVQRKIGQTVPRFDKDKWRKICDGVMETAVRAKFGQHSSLRKQLIDTWPARLVEGSPIDSYWGIGLSRFSQAALTPSRWLGRNRLGDILCKIREELMTGTPVFQSHFDMHHGRSGPAAIDSFDVQVPYTTLTRNSK